MPSETLLLYGGNAIPVTHVKPVHTSMSEAEWNTRCELAALYRVLHTLRWTDLIYTHMSARVPGEPEHFLINNFGEMFDEVTASSLVKLDFDGTVQDDHALEHVNNAGFVIHSAVYMARPDVQCVLHLHTRASIAVSAQHNGLLPLSQHAMMVLGSLAYHDYNIAAGRLEERETLGKDCAKGDAVILRNHGTLAMGCSIPNAFERMYYLETSCQIQVEAMSCGQELIMIEQDVLQRGMARAEARFKDPTAGQRVWESMLRMLDRDGITDYRR